MKNGIFVISNIPFIIGYYLIFKSILDLKEEKKAAAVYIIFYIINTAFFLMEIPKQINLAVIAGSLIIISFICYQGSASKKLGASIVVLCYSFFMEMSAGYLVSAISREPISVVVEDNLYASITIVVSKLLLLLSGAISHTFLAPHIKKEQKPPRWWLLLMCVPICSILLAVCIFYSNQEVNSEVMNRIMAVSAALIFGLNMGAFYLIYKIYEEYNNRLELEQLKQTMQLYRENYEIQLSYVKKIEGYRHDIKNLYLRTMAHLESGDYEEAKRVIREETDIVIQFGQTVNTGNVELDWLLNYKLSLAASNEIETKVFVKLKEPLAADKRDLYILLGNLLDNAIEAAEKADPKYVDIHIESGEGTVYIKIKNTYTGDLKREGETILTSKAEKAGHGIGIKNITRVVKKYDGQIKLKEEPPYFIVDIYILNGE